MGEMILVGLYINTSKVVMLDIYFYLFLFYAKAEADTALSLPAEYRD